MADFALKFSTMIYYCKYGKKKRIGLTMIHRDILSEHIFTLPSVLFKHVKCDILAQKDPFQGNTKQRVVI